MYLTLICKQSLVEKVRQYNVCKIKCKTLLIYPLSIFRILHPLIPQLFTHLPVVDYIRIWNLYWEMFMWESEPCICFSFILSQVVLVKKKGVKQIYFARYVSEFVPPLSETLLRPWGLCLSINHFIWSLIPGGFCLSINHFICGSHVMSSIETFIM